jgi:predicted DsbA family dithiol-disulfide isomerase
MRSAILLLAAVLFSGCAAAKQSDQAVEKMLRSKKVVDLDKLTGSELQLLVSIVRKEASPCPNELSLLEDLSRADPCPRAVSALGFLYRRILDGYPESDILDQYVSRFKEAAQVKINIEGRPDTGPADAPVTIVTFSDFQCPFCRKAALQIKQIKQLYPESVRLVFKHFPLDYHNYSMEAAIAAEAALAQGRFWEMHDRLFALKGELSDEAVEGAASSAGLDLTRWKEDMESSEVIERISADREEAIELKLGGTPTIFVNGIEFEEPIKYLEQYVVEFFPPP